MKYTNNHQSFKRGPPQKRSGFINKKYDFKKGFKNDHANVTGARNKFFNSGSKNVTDQSSINGNNPKNIPVHQSKNFKRYFDVNMKQRKSFNSDPEKVPSDTHGNVFNQHPRNNSGSQRKFSSQHPQNTFGTQRKFVNRQPGNKFGPDDDDDVAETNSNQMENKFNHKKRKIELPDSESPFFILWEKYRPRSTPHVNSENIWVYQLMKERTETEPVPLKVRRRLKELAEQLYKDDMSILDSKRQSQNDKSSKFHKAIFTHGTTKDKIAAHTLCCMESPIYNLTHLFKLVDFVDAKFKTNLSEAIDKNKDVFSKVLLPNGHVAKEFESHNFSMLIPLLQTAPEQVEKQLILWYFESQVQLAYLKLIDNLEKISNATMPKVKQLGVKGLNDFLQALPHQDAEVILQKLVGKLGDVKKISGSVLEALTKIQVARPTLKSTLVALIEELLYRNNVHKRSQFYGLCFLKNIILSLKDDDLPERLSKLYFSFFQSCSKEGEVNSRFMGAILSGLNRVFPYLGNDKKTFLEDQMKILFKITHYVQFSLATQAMQLIYQVQNHTTSESTDRFYSLLYGKMLEVGLGNVSGISAFLNIVFKSMVKDPEVVRLRAFVRRFLQVSLHLSSPIGCSALFLISEAIKDNSNVDHIKSLLHRSKDPQEIVGIKLEEDEEDDYEYYPDLNADEDDENKQELLEDKIKVDMPEPLPKSSIIKSESSWIHREQIKVTEDKSFVRTTHYDPTIRNPLYCGSDLSPMWELQLLKNHFHPTVSLFATNLLNEEHILYSGNPLQDFTTVRFLDRFTLRNPKKKRHDENSSTPFPKKGLYTPSGARNVPTDSKSFHSLPKEKVPIEDVFLYNYFTRFRKEKTKVVDSAKKKDDSDSIDDEEFDEYMKRMKGVKEMGLGFEADELDFAGNVAVAAKEAKTKGSNKKKNMEDEIDMDENDFEVDDFEDDEFEDEFEDEFDELEGSEEDEFGEPSPKVRGNKGKSKSSRELKDDSDYADEFSNLLEEYTEKDPLAGTSEAVSNKDKANRKQLIWEKKQRDTDALRKVHKRKPGNKKFSGKRNFGGKKSGSKNFGGRKSFGKQNFKSRGKGRK